MRKLIDCITFFDNNYIFDFRYNVIKSHIDKFIVCESLFDHKNKPKKINFDPDNKYKDNPQVIHLILKDPFPKKTNPWQNQAIQREYILENLNFMDDEDLIFFSDPDEIPNPNVLANFTLKKKYGIFLQKFYNYKFNLFNSYETPWEGTKVCKKKDLKSINLMREKIKKKNLRYKFFRIDKEKNIEIFESGGWHFNNLMQPDLISKKLKTFAHSEYSGDEFSSIEVIKKKIEARVDLFNRGEKYDYVKLDNTFPEHLLNNLKKYKDYIID